MKKAFIIFTVLAVLVISTLFGLQSFIKHIYNRTDCVRYNIDNIELRTGINIPAVLDVDCNSNDSIKTSVFVLDTTQVNVEEYITKNELVLQNDRYVKSNDNENTKWSAELDMATKALTVVLEYK